MSEDRRMPSPAAVARLAGQLRHHGAAYVPLLHPFLEALARDPTVTRVRIHRAGVAVRMGETVFHLGEGQRGGGPEQEMASVRIASPAHGVIGSVSAAEVRRLGPSGHRRLAARWVARLRALARRAAPRRAHLSSRPEVSIVVALAEGTDLPGRIALEWLAPRVQAIELGGGGAAGPAADAVGLTDAHWRTLLAAVCDRGFGPSVLAAIAASSDPPPFEVIVVDRGAGRTTLEFLSCLEGDLLRVAAPGAGVLKARNMGAERARGNLLFFVGSTVLIEPGCLAGLVRMTTGAPRTAAVGPCLLHPDGSIAHGGYGFDPERLPVDLFRWFPATDPAARRPRSVQAVSGAALLVRRDAFWRVGGFRAGLGARLGAVDLCLRLRTAGLGVRWEPSVAARYYRLAADTRPPATAVRSFLARWRNLIVPDEAAHYRASGLVLHRFATGGKRIERADPESARLLSLAMDRERRGRFAEALAAARRVEAGGRQPALGQAIAARLLAARCRAALGDPGAGTDYRRVLELDPYHPGALFALAAAALARGARAEWEQWAARLGMVSEPSAGLPAASTPGDEQRPAGRATGGEPPAAASASRVAAHCALAEGPPNKAQ